ncbi:type IV toxin-antitoxin system AbiEi family antitoxin [Georgenia sp. SYP-B2076]|uniref:type IV toxin-antitoxin system AbiEi family antitoxin n=1 Tax=Georgenia sp. SYP-B2076 TaxID=2495881 RepID=UPI0013E050CE|nr:type IV toxin-antitoxin system AbiEi family antitoxin [Georgenia sp. SYP-B2076]
MTRLPTDEPFTLARALGAGVTPRELTALTRAGGLVRPFRGIYSPADLATDADALVRAVGLLVPEGAALARESAAWLHGVDIRPPGRFREPPALEVVSSTDMLLNRVRRPDVVGYVADLPPGDVVTVSGLRVTSPARTALDLARYTERYMGLAALDMFSHQRLITLDEVTDRISAMPGQRWIARARAMLALADARTELPGESWTRLRIHESRLPMPDLQIRLRDETGREIYRLDMGYRDRKVALEFDGEKFHRTTTEQARHDQARRTDIERRWGWTTYAFHVGDVLGRRPVVEATIIEALGISGVPARRVW